MRQQTEVLKAILEALQNKPIPAGKSALVSLVSSLPTQNYAVAQPSKEELARQWFTQHPGDRQKPGRDLEANCQPMNVKISYVTWNKIKKETLS